MKQTTIKTITINNKNVNIEINNQSWLFKSENNFDKIINVYIDFVESVVIPAMKAENKKFNGIHTIALSKTGLCDKGLIFKLIELATGAVRAAESVPSIIWNN